MDEIFYYGNRFRISPNGLVGGMNFSGTYHNGDFALTGGFGASGNMTSWGGGISYDGIGASYYRTTFGNETGPDGKSNAQVVGGVGINIKDFSLRVENDLWGDKGDRWRTSAAELTIGKFSVGTYLYTNDGGKDSNYQQDEGENCRPPKFLGFINSRNKNEGLSTWTNGRPYSAPLWIGYRNGNQITRIGFSHKTVHNLTQNMVHKFMDTPYYMSYDEFRGGGYFYTGYRNPLSLWDR